MKKVGWMEWPRKSRQVIHNEAAKGKKAAGFLHVYLHLKCASVQVQSTQTEKTIKKKFRKLYRFLWAEETARIDAVRKEEAQKSKQIKDNIAKLESGISALMQKITNVEKEMSAKDFPFLQVLYDYLCCNVHINFLCLSKH